MPELGKQIQASGESGRYVFADLAEVDSIILELKSMRQELFVDGYALDGAIDEVAFPAEDVMSRDQARAYRDSLRKAYSHNQMMSSYINDQIDKLSTARNAYAEADSAAASRLRVDQ